MDENMTKLDEVLLLAEVPLGKIDMVRKSLIDDLIGGSL